MNHNRPSVPRRRALTVTTSGRGTATSRRSSDPGAADHRARRRHLELRRGRGPAPTPDSDYRHDRRLGPGRERREIPPGPRAPRRRAGPLAGAHDAVDTPGWLANSSRITTGRDGRPRRPAKTLSQVAIIATPSGCTRSRSSGADTVRTSASEEPEVLKLSSGTLSDAARQLAADQRAPGVPPHPSPKLRNGAQRAATRRPGADQPGEVNHDCMCRPGC